MIASRPDMSSHITGCLGDPFPMIGMSN